MIENFSNRIFILVFFSTNKMREKVSSIYTIFGKKRRYTKSTDALVICNSFQ